MTEASGTRAPDASGGQGRPLLARTKRPLRAARPSVRCRVCRRALGLSPRATRSCARYCRSVAADLIRAVPFERAVLIAPDRLLVQWDSREDDVLDHIEVCEDDEVVVISVFERVGTGLQLLVAFEREAEVKLAAPLGDREVRDANPAQAISAEQPADSYARLVYRD